MVNINVITVPEKKEDKDVSYKYQKIVEDRNNSIAKRFNVEPKDVNLKLHFNKSALISELGPNGESMGIFAGYSDGSDNILIVHPDSVADMFDDIEKQMLIWIDYTLVKFYLCKKYFPERLQFKLFYKYVSEVLAQITAGSFKEESIKFDLRMFNADRRYTKEQELLMVFYLMLKNSGLGYIYEHLDKIMQDCDIKKTVFSIYRKDFSELAKVAQKEAIEEKRKAEELERAKRAAAREKAMNSSS